MLMPVGVNSAPKGCTACLPLPSGTKSASRCFSRVIVWALNRFIMQKPRAVFILHPTLRLYWQPGSAIPESTR